MDYKTRIYEHLALYKTNVLRIHEQGEFIYRGEIIPKPHILPAADYRCNLLDAYRDDFFSSEHGTNINLHRYFHHLNSSQALCINLFYPLIAENQLGLFSDYLNIGSDKIKNAEFEKESDLEEAERKTSFDFFVQNTSDTKIYVEVKYTENGFGKAKLDDEHKEKFSKTYKPILERISEFIKPICLEESFFLNHYQLLRNLVHINQASCVVLLFPKNNHTVMKEAIEAKDTFLTDAGREKLKIIFLEDFVAYIENNTSNDRLSSFYRGFRTKYLQI